MKRILGALALAAVALAGVTAIPPAANAEVTNVDQGIGMTPPTPHILPQADLRLFEPGHIISDALFFDWRTMTATDIQNFLNAKGSRCTSTSTAWCLKDYRVDSVAKPADQFCDAITPIAHESAASIISRVSTACKVNPQVILVTLQKEQSLVLKTTPSTYQGTYYKAMGYRCPDFQACDPAHAGFFLQVYGAAHRFQEYVQQPWRFNYRVNTTVDIKYHPNTACGSSQVYLKNAATAALYNYTPFQPNAAIINGTPDACSATGNINFFRYFTDWFGPTVTNPPIGHIDSVTTSAVSAVSGAVTASGWALDKDNFNSVKVQITLGQDTYLVAATGARPDVDAAYHRGPNKGWTFKKTVPSGNHQFCVTVLDNESGPSTNLGCRWLTVPATPNKSPFGMLDSVTVSGARVTAAGWALDPDGGNPIPVHVYVGKAGYAVTANLPRPDVGAAYGTSGAHGFEYSGTFQAGTYNVCAYAINFPVGDNPVIGCRQVEVGDQSPFGSVDSVSLSGDGVTVSGWAHDPDTKNPIRVQVYVDWSTNVVATANQPRPDVAAVIPTAGGSHGYSVTIAAPPGQHTVCTYAINVGPGSSKLIGCRDVYVPAGNPLGNLEHVTLGPGSISVGGWAFDPDTTNPIIVQMYVDWNQNAMTWADIPRPDVAAVYPNAGPNHGFALTMHTTPGPHTLCLYAINAGPGASKQFVCGHVTVP